MKQIPAFFTDLHKLSIDYILEMSVTEARMVANAMHALRIACDDDITIPLEKELCAAANLVERGVDREHILIKILPDVGNCPNDTNPIETALLKDILK